MRACNRNLIPGVLAGVLMIAWTTSRGEVPDKATTMPQVVQFDFGAGGSKLPNDGLEYCAPTTWVMNLAWLGIAGHTRIGPQTADITSPSYQSYLYNLEVTLSGLMGTAAFGGGTNSNDILPGVETYLAMKGYSGQYSAMTNGIYGPTADGQSGSGPLPTLADLTYAVTDTDDQLVVGSFMLGWYNNDETVWKRESGHVPALVSATAPDQIVINNPYPQAGFGSQQTITVNDVAAGQMAKSGDVTYSIAGGLNITDGMVGNSATPYSEYYLPVVEQYYRLAISLAVPVASAWELNPGENVIDIGGAEQDVLAPIQDGSGGSSFAFQGGGKLVFTESAEYSGGTRVSDGGTLESRHNSGTPFGTGGIQLESGTLSFKPKGTGGDVMLSAGTASGGETFSYGGQSRVILDKGDNNSLAVAFGNGNGELQALEPYSALIIKANSGIAALGNTEKFVINGDGPPVTNGMVAPTIMGEDSDSSGYFLTYGADGFQAAVETNSASVDINDATATVIYAATTAQTVETKAEVQAIRVQDVTVSGGAGSVLKVGDGVMGGVALNRGVIATETLDFGSATGVVYVSEGESRIDAVIQGGNVQEGLIVQGKGRLELTQANEYAGDTFVLGGMLIASNTTGSATGTGVVGVAQGGVLSGAGTVQDVEVGEGGKVTGAVHIGGSLMVDAGGTMSGNGTVSGVASMAGTLTDLVSEVSPSSDLTFQGDLTMESGSTYVWVMRSYTDDHTASIPAGMQNDTFVVNGTLTWDYDTTMLLDLTRLGGPETGDSFWLDSHSWIVATAGSLPYLPSLDQAPFTNGSFYLDGTSTEMKLRWTPVPEPSTWALLALGGGVAGWILRRRKRSALA